MAEDSRNCEVTNKIFSVLNEVKGFEVAMGTPRSGKLLIRYEGVTFGLEIEPVFRDTPEGKKCEDEPFNEIVNTHKYLLK